MGRAVILLTIGLQLSVVLSVCAQSPTLHYTLAIDSTDLSGYTVTIGIQHAPHHFRLAMATHHEYDDRFWRYITGFRVSAPATFSREDSAVWAITSPDGNVTVAYRIHLPPPAPIHFAHRPFLAPYGGLVGDLHSFMYVVEAPHARCALTLRLPRGWQSASGFDNATTTPRLLDAPILVGRLHRWTFTVDNIPHDVIWLSPIPIPGFDTVALVSNIRKIVQATVKIFGGFPYQHYSFLLEDSSVGALEHGNSVTIGGSGTEEIAHEFFHTWNLMSIRPSGYTELNYGTQQQSPGLWFSEGATMLYADLICRRTGLPVEDSTRLAHLAGLITRYYANAGNSLLPPTRVSLAANLQPGPLGDYEASTHLQGELLGECLDILIRDATDGHRSLDDVMRAMYRRYGGQRPFADTDIEKVVTDICGCAEAVTFFRDYLYEGKPIDFAPWLNRLGLRLQHDQLPATDPQGRPLPDTRVYPWIRRDDSNVRIMITNPNSCWGQAGLHTGDIITSINGQPIHTRQDFQTALRAVRIGDTITINGKEILISGYTRPVITISTNPAATSKQRRLLDQWLRSLTTQ